MLIKQTADSVHRILPFIEPSVEVVHRPDGTVLATCPIPLPPIAKSFPDLFENTVRAYPHRVFMRQRKNSDGPWQAITYAEALQAAKSIAQWFLNDGCSRMDVVAIISGPSINHALVMLGAQFAGMAVAPLTAGYALLSTDFVKLKKCVEQCAARYVFAEEGKSYRKAINALTGANPALTIITGDEPGDLNVLSLDVLNAVAPTEQVGAATAAIRLESIARIMFTSGSTGSPKAAPQPHNCLVTTVAQAEALGLLDFDGEAPQCLEAMPFSHIMAGNFNFNNVVRAGGTINLDEGKPTPQLFHHTIQNLREISPHFFITVPLGYAMLCDAMEQDAPLRDSFFKNLRYIGFGGAVLPNLVAARLQKLAVAARGAEIPIYSFYGATEFLFGALQYWNCPRMDVIGLPLPALTWKLVPVGNKYELRVKAPTMMPRSGYLGAEAESSKLFDEEDFYKTGDLVAWLDPDDPKQGLLFEGRLSEEFKLSTGTWVSVARLRTQVLSACDPLVQEVVVCGLNREWIGLLLWINEANARRLMGGDAEKFSLEALVQHPQILNALKHMIQKHNATATGTSLRVARVMVMEEPLRESEMTVKAAASQRMVQIERAADIERLYLPNTKSNIIDCL